MSRARLRRGCAALAFAAAAPLLAGAARAAPQEAAAQQALTPLEGAPESREAVIGQPVAWRVTLSEGALARGADAAPIAAALSEAGWVVLDGPRDEGPRARVWTLMALDPGPRATVDLELALEDGRVVTAPLATLEVRGELAEGEDAPRPARPFREVLDHAVLRPSTFLALTLGALVTLGLAAAALRAKRRRGTAPTGARVPTPAEALGALEPGADPAGAVAALGPLLRRAVDAALGAPADACTDDEWRAKLGAAPGLSGEFVARLDALVARSSEVRFSGVAPSSLGAKELVAEARAALDALAATAAAPALPGQQGGAR